jgi:hypothetical protein
MKLCEPPVFKTTYDQHLELRRQFLESELPKQQDKFLKDNGWKRRLIDARSYIEPNLCMVYRYKESCGNYVKIQIYSNGSITEIVKKVKTASYDSWKEFIDKYRWPQKPPMIIKGGRMDK